MYYSLVNTQPDSGTTAQPQPTTNRRLQPARNPIGRGTAYLAFGLRCTTQGAVVDTGSAWSCLCCLAFFSHCSQTVHKYRYMKMLWVAKPLGPKCCGCAAQLLAVRVVPVLKRITPAASNAGLLSVCVLPMPKSAYHSNACVPLF